MKPRLVNQRVGEPSLIRAAVRHAVRVLAACSATIFCGGCLFHPLQLPPRPPEPAPKNLCRQPGAAQKSSGFQVIPTQSDANLGKKRDYQELTLTNSLEANGRTLQIDYYLPNLTPAAGEAPQKSPCILILPIMGGTQYDLERFFGRSFAKRGFATAILHRPDLKSEVHQLEAIDGLLLRSLQDAQSAIDWFETRPEIDPGRIGLFGVSLGAIRATLVLGVDPRVRAAVLGLVGGDLPYILTHSREKGLVRERDKLLAAQHLSLEQAEARLRASITCDPLTVAPAVDPSRVLMVIAAFDKSIPASKGWELRRKLGNPATVQLFSGHYSSVIYAPYLRWKTGKFFEEHLGK
ncbi:MAG TPA: hypothetical protein VN794_10170 [Methylomirabilota bacterium]|nr:hypothetical protein [Methylomirabilota bacterium]